MAEIKNENFITIQAFMVKDLELSGNELIAYALIYGFSQDGESQFRGSLSYITEWLNCSKTTAFNLLNKLADDGFLVKNEKYINGVKLCDYIAVNPSKEELQEIKQRKQNRKQLEKIERRSKKLNTHSKNCNGVFKKIEQGVQKVVTHNNNINIKDNIKDNIGEVHTSVPEKQKPSQNTFDELKAKEKDMVNRFSGICESHIDDLVIRDTVRNIFERYICIYNLYTCKIHPILTTETLINVCITLSTLCNDYNHFDIDDIYKPNESGFAGLDNMLSAHFARKHRKDTNYSITHFANAEYLGKLAESVIEY